MPRKGKKTAKITNLVTEKLKIRDLKWDLDKLANNGQKLEVIIRGHCGMTIFEDVNGNSYHFDGMLGKQQLPKTLIPIKLK